MTAARAGALSCHCPRCEAEKSEAVASRAPCPPVLPPARSGARGQHRRVRLASLRPLRAARLLRRLPLGPRGDTSFIRPRSTLAPPLEAVGRQDGQEEGAREGRRESEEVSGAQERENRQKQRSSEPARSRKSASFVLPRPLKLVGSGSEYCFAAPCQCATRFPRSTRKRGSSTSFRPKAVTAGPCS